MFYSHATKHAPPSLPPAPATTGPDLHLLQASRPAVSSPRRVLLQEPPGQRFRQLINQLDDQSQGIDHAMDQARRGKSFSPLELLAIQTKVYSYSQNMEVISRLVDRTVSSIKTTLNTQV